MASFSENLTRSKKRRLHATNAIVTSFEEQLALLQENENALQENANAGV